MLGNLKADTEVRVSQATLLNNNRSSSGGQAVGGEECNGQVGNNLQSDDSVCLDPSQLSGKTLVLCKSISLMLHTKGGSSKKTELSLTDPVLSQGPVGGDGEWVAEGNDGSEQLSSAEVLHSGGESVSGVRLARGDLASELAVHQLDGVEGLGGPVSLRLLENSGVELPVVIAEVLVVTAQGCVVLQDIVTTKVATGQRKMVSSNSVIGIVNDSRHLQAELCSVGDWVGNKSLVEHDLGQRLIEVETLRKSINNDALGQVAAVVVKVSVVGQGVHHGARTTQVVGSGKCPLLDGTARSVSILVVGGVMRARDGQGGKSQRSGEERGDHGDLRRSDCGYVKMCRGTRSANGRRDGNKQMVRMNGGCCC